jgi:hypothetical protein
MIRASLFSVALLALLAPSTASAGLMLTANDIIPTSYQPANSNPGAAEILAYLNGSSEDAYKNQTLSGVGTLLFKWNQGNNGGSEEAKPLSSSYDVTNQVNNGTTQGTLDYVGGNIVDTTNPAWLVVKGGNSGFVVYDLDSVGTKGVQWNGVEDLIFTNANLFGPQSPPRLQSISNIQVWGGSTTPPPTGGPGVVPEPTTLAIWSVLGIGGLVSRRRNRAKRS